MAVSLGYLEHMITYCDGLTLDTIYMIGVDDCRPVNSDEVVFWQYLLPCSQREYRAVRLCTALDVYVAIVVI